MKRNTDTPPKTPLDAWMKREDISDRVLAEKMGYADATLVFRVRTGRRAAQPAFHARFLRVYGIEVAESIFGPLTPQAEEAPA